MPQTSRLLTLARIALRTYPRAWRQRYGDEFSAMIESQELTTRDVFDIGRGAIREQLWPSVRLPDSSWLLAARAGVAAGASLWLFAWLLFPLFRWQTIHIIPIETLIQTYIEPRWLTNLWLVPLVTMLMAYAAARPFAPRRRGLLAVATVVTTVLVGLAWTNGESGLRVLSEGRFLFAASKLWPFAAMFAIQAMAIFVVLDRRSASARSAGAVR